MITQKSSPSLSVWFLSAVLMNNNSLPGWKLVILFHAIMKSKPVTEICKHLRPMSLTPALSKVAEEFVVSKYIGPAILCQIDPNQFGVILKSSTSMTAISVIHKWTQSTCSQNSPFWRQKGGWPYWPWYTRRKDLQITSSKSSRTVDYWFSAAQKTKS